MKEIKFGNQLLAIIDTVENFPKGLSFYGHRLDYLQVGSFCYDSGHIMRSHQHKFRHKLAHKTQEIVIVFKGRCIVYTYPEVIINEDNRIYEIPKTIDESILESGYFYISYFGGCGFKILEDNTRMLEVKNGPHDTNNDSEERALLV